MDFFREQERARRLSFWMILMFALGVLCLVAAVDLLVYLAVYEDLWYPKTPEAQKKAIFTLAAVGGGTLLLILGASWFRAAQLRAGGGRSVAEALGGRLVEEPQDLKERQLLNIVEEMALASGLPVPPVYIMDGEGAINAFAAGNSPEDAVVAVTRGTLESLNREELQGVIGHEFSHILNGDMRLNIRLMGLLFGIYVVYLIGWYLLKSTFFYSSGASRSSEDGGRNAGGKLVLFFIALWVMLLGCVGLFLGNVIKAALSRQREYLADASAVQFTRDPKGIANALKKIGGMDPKEQTMHSTAAAEASHLFFSSFSASFFANLFATHPPLERRIRRLDPHFNPEIASMLKTERAGKMRHGVSSETRNSGGSGASEPMVSGFAPGTVPREARPRKTHSGRAIFQKQMSRACAASNGTLAAALLNGSASQKQKGKAGGKGKKNIKNSSASEKTSVTTFRKLTLRETIENSLGASAYVLALLTDEKNAEIRTQQKEMVAQLMNGIFVQEYGRILSQLQGMTQAERLANLQLALPAMRQLSLAQYRSVRTGICALIEADHVVDLNEYVIYAMVCRQLDIVFGLRNAPNASGKMTIEMFRAAVLVLSRLAYAGSSVREEQEKAFRLGLELLNVADAELLPETECSNQKLQKALILLDSMEIEWKRDFIDACDWTIKADGVETDEEMALRYSIAAVLGIYGAA
ncbi:MAG: M48 family metallopeptidase [Thermoguttaceae bacterium]|nr:M48 family metallopeptidase [Thermoguttaceae bacterium]